MLPVDICVGEKMCPLLCVAIECNNYLTSLCDQYCMLAKVHMLYVKSIDKEEEY